MTTKVDEATAKAQEAVDIAQKTDVKVMQIHEASATKMEVQVIKKDFEIEKKARVAWQQERG